VATQVSPGTRVPSSRPAPGPIGFLDDAALARLVAGGDDRAFEALYERHRGGVYRYCAATTGHAHDAGEAFQLTMLAAYRALAAGRPPRGPITPWLLRIAHDECMDLLRARPRVEELAEAPDPGAVGDPEGAEMRERLRRLRADIAALPLRQRSALVLREINGLSHAAIGAALGTDPAAARHLLHEARLSLMAPSAGRELECREVCRRISDGDRRTLRARPVRGHLRACEPCAAFADEQDERRRRLAAWWLVLPAAAAAEVLRGILVGPGIAAAAGSGAPPSRAPVRPGSAGGSATGGVAGPGVPSTSGASSSPAARSG
jgi:RNA polymerase sigma factor (sigma-70 family)